MTARHAGALILMLLLGVTIWWMLAPGAPPPAPPPLSERGLTANASTSVPEKPVTNRLPLADEPASEQAPPPPAAVAKQHPELLGQMRALGVAVPEPLSLTPSDWRELQRLWQATARAISMARSEYQNVGMRLANDRFARGGFERLHPEDHPVPQLGAQESRPWMMCSSKDEWISSRHQVVEGRSVVDVVRFLPGAVSELDLAREKLHDTELLGRTDIERFFATHR